MLSFRKYLFFIFISLFTFRAMAVFEFESLKLGNHEFLAQSANDCVPTSFFYMLKYGNTDLRKAYDAVSGESDNMKLATIIDFGLKNHFFDSNDGAKRMSFQPWMEALLQKGGAPTSLYQTSMAHRLEGEEDPGTFVRRIHSKILSSLKKQVPVMIGAELSRTDHNRNSDFSYELSHTIVIIGVQKELSDSEAGFAIWYLDPAFGEIFSGYIYEELNQPFNARVFESPESEAWSWSDGKLGVVKSDGAFMSSPYLRLVAPSIGSMISLDWDQTRNLFVDTMMVGTEN